MSSMLAARRNSKPWYIIDPRRSRTFLPGWDLLTTFCLIFTAIVTPFEVAFLKLPETASEALSDPLFLVNRIIDLTFAFDLVLNFLLMYQDTSALDGVKWIDEPSAIVKHYLRGWFALDLFSVLPSAFDLLPYMLESSSASGARMDEGEDILTRFKFLRVVRCLRLVKLMRLLRASRMMSRWETRLSINYNMASMCKVLVGYLLVAHWSACALVLPTTFYDHPVLSWLGHYGYCIAETASGGVPGAPGEGYPYDDCYRTINLARGLHADHTLVEELLDDGTCQVRCEAPDRLFVAAFYFTLQMICGATGGPFDREGFDVWEQIIFAFLTAIGALVWGQVIGTVVSVVANANSDVTWFRSTMDELNQFMHLYSLPQETRMRLREYFTQSRHVRHGQQRKRILKQMSPLLQGEVALAINSRWLKSINFLIGAETELVVLVACSLQPAVFIPGELVTPGSLYVIHKGVALYGGRLLTSGRCWGQDMILARQHLCRFAARAMSYLEVYRISRAELLELARPFPIALRRIR